MPNLIQAVELKNVKIYQGMSEETTAFTATLYINGKKAAHVKNDGRGGDNYPRFTDGELEKQFHAFCKNLPPWTSKYFPGEEYPMNYDCYISDLLNAWIENDHWKKACKKGLVFILRSDKEDEYRTTKGQYSKELAAKIRGTYGTDGTDELVEIVNERFLAKEENHA
jgi:hypothetical protein